jgi:hypothetical protein
MALLIALLGATVLLSALVLVAGYRQRGEVPSALSPADARRESRRTVDASPATSTWMFSGGAGLS